MFEAMGPYCYALFTRVLGWSKTEIEVLVAGTRRELRDLSLHLYTKVRVIYGQKPETVWLYIKSVLMDVLAVIIILMEWISSE